MVYRGKPSKGCQYCRERKIRVSELANSPTLLGTGENPIEPSKMDTLKQAGLLTSPSATSVSLVASIVQRHAANVLGIETN